MSIDDFSVTEGNIGTNGALAIVRLSSPSAQTVTVDFVAGAGTATSSVDFQPTFGTLNFPPGVSTQMVSVVVNGDIAIETDETFLVNLSNPVNATVAVGQATGTILNDDGFAGQVDHFAWSAISSPLLGGQPFQVSITAQDAFNSTVTNFTGTAALSGRIGIEPVTNRILGDLVHQFNDGAGNSTLGYSFTPNTNLIVTHVRHYSGTKVSIWTDSGALLASQNVSSVGGTWNETPLTTPLQLSAGERYRVGVYSDDNIGAYYGSAFLQTFPHGSVNQSYSSFGDTFPSGIDNILYFVDLRYSVGFSIPVAITPTVSGNFVGGNWTGNLTVLEPVTDLVLKAEDADGHSGTANPVSVVFENDLGVGVSDSPDPVLAGADLTYTITVTNTGPATATGVTITNVLPESATLVSIASSQGNCTNAGNTITCELGTLETGTNATLTIVVSFASSGFVTNRVEVGRAEADGYFPNNTVFTPTRIKPRLGGQFRITTLSANGSAVVEHEFLTGDDRGGIAASASQVFYTGDNSTAHFALGDLSGGANLDLQYEALTSDLHAERVYSLGDGNVPISNGGGTVSTLLEIDGATGLLTGNQVTLSTPITAGNNTGIFAGYDQVVLHNGSRVYSIALPSGVVTDLGFMANPIHRTCESWAYWGVAEFFGSDLYLVYVENSTRIARARVPDGIISTVQTFENLSDTCSITVSVPRNRWYFKHERASQFGGTFETIGFADAAFEVSSGAPTLSIVVGRPSPTLQAARIGNSCRISFMTIVGRTYVLESADSMNSSTWTRLGILSGDGTKRFLEDRRPAIAERFYRVRMY